MYHSERKCKGRLVFILIPQQLLYFRPELFIVRRVRFTEIVVQKLRVRFTEIIRNLGAVTSNLVDRKHRFSKMKKSGLGGQYCCSSVSYCEHIGVLYCCNRYAFCEIRFIYEHYRRTSLKPEHGISICGELVRAQ